MSGQVCLVGQGVDIQVVAEVYERVGQHGGEIVAVSGKFGHRLLDVLGLTA